MVAILYDVHGNLPALEAVLADAEAARAERFVLGGDYALFGPWPAETVERLRELDAEWIRGNGERWTAHPNAAPDDEVVQGAIAYCREQLGETVVGELAALPETLIRDGVRYVHASPLSDVQSFMPDAHDGDDEMLEGVIEQRLVFGHTHLPFRRMSEAGIELVNPGSVGMPFDGDPRAAYALLAGGGDIEHRRVEYDHERSAEAIRERGEGRFGEVVARRIAGARFEP
jgi:diadenosine tetraphosphatase ApaH/serine/threonine PP2A family protein phosphatase